jgi:glucose uptake protein GlcU
MNLSEAFPHIFEEAYENVKKIDNYQDLVTYVAHMMNKSIDQAKREQDAAMKAVLPCSIAMIFCASVIECLKENPEASYASVRNAVQINFHAKAHTALGLYKKKEGQS